jgi:hypothetical protein
VSSAAVDTVSRPSLTAIAGTMGADPGTPGESVHDGPVAPAMPPMAAAVAPAREGRATAASGWTERIVLPPDRVVGSTAEHTEPASFDPNEERRHQRDVVVGVVHQYARALERLDVGAATALYPTVDGRELRRSLNGLKAVQYHIASCGVSFSTSGDDAHATCTGNATFRPKVGSRVVRITGYEWELSLARGGTGWQILDSKIQ